MLLILALGSSLATPISSPQNQSCAADEAKGEKVEFATYSDYFEKNTSGLKGESSYLEFTDRDAFDKVFALRPPLMGKKSVGLPDGAFEKKLVVAVVKRGLAPTTYKLGKTTTEGDALYLQYTAAAGKPTTATFASPLIVAVDRGKIRTVVFIENEKTAAKLEVK